MIRKRATPDGANVEVTFAVDHGPIDPVALVGDFNDWDEGATVLESRGNGVLAVTLTMPVGNRYEFRYRDARGRWFNDESADDYAENEFGGMNAVLLT